MAKKQGSSEPRLDYVPLEPDRWPGWATYSAEKQSLWLSVPIEGGWTVAYRFLAVRGQPVLAELRIHPTEEEAFAGEWSGYVGDVPEGGLMAKQARVRLDWARKHAAGLIRKLEEERGPSVYDRAEGVLGQRRITPKGVKELREARKGRWATSSDWLYARTAQLYLEAVESPDEKGPPRRYVAEQMGVDPQKTTIRWRLNEARRRGLLERPTKAGTPGGRLTEEAERILREGPPDNEEEERGEERKGT